MEGPLGDHWEPSPARGPLLVHPAPVNPRSQVPSETMHGVQGGLVSWGAHTLHGRCSLSRSGSGCGPLPPQSVGERGPPPINGNSPYLCPLISWGGLDPSVHIPKGFPSSHSFSLHTGRSVDWARDPLSLSLSHISSSFTYRFRFLLRTRDFFSGILLSSLSPSFIKHQLGPSRPFNLPTRPPTIPLYTSSPRL